MPPSTPRPLGERLAAEGLPGQSLRGQLALDHHLRGDAGVIGAGLPERVPPLHAAPPYQHVLHRIGEGVAHMQAARHVGRGDHDGVGRGVAAGVGSETAALLPLRVEFGFGVGWAEGFVEHSPVLGPVPRVEKRPALNPPLEGKAAFTSS